MFWKQIAYPWYSTHMPGTHLTLSKNCQSTTIINFLPGCLKEHNSSLRENPNVIENPYPTIQALRFRYKNSGLGLAWVKVRFIRSGEKVHICPLQFKCGNGIPEKEIPWCIIINLIISGHAYSHDIAVNHIASFQLCRKCDLWVA